MKELEIVLKIRDEQARASAKATLDSVARIEAAFKRSVDAQEKAERRAWAARQKAEAAALKAANDVAVAREKAAVREAVAQEKAAAKGLAATQKALAAAQKAAQSASAASVKAAERELAAREKAAQKAADVAAKAAQKAAAAIAKSANDAANAQARAEAKATEEATRGAARKSEAAKKVMAATATASEKRIEAERRASQKILDLAAARVAKLDQLGRQQLTKEELMLRARAQANQKLQRAKVDDAAKALGAESKGWFSLEGGAKRAADAVLAAGAAYATLRTAKAIVTGISEAWAAQRRDVEESVLRISGYQAKLLELADLKDRLGRTTPELGAQLAIRAQTTQSAEDAQKFNEGLLNAGAVAVKGGLIPQAELEKLAVAGGKAQVVKGMGAEAAGNFFGALPGIFGGQNQKADDVAARGLGISKILQAGSASATSGIGQFRAVSGLATGGAFGAPDIAPEALASTVSFFTGMRPDSGGEFAQQFVRGTTGALDRTRRGGIEGGEAQGAYLDRLGAKPGMTAPEIGVMIANDLNARKRADPKFNVDSYLAHHGYGNQDERLVLGYYANGVDNGQVQTFLGMGDPAKRQGIGPAMGEIDASLRVDQTAKDRISDLAKDQADAARSLGAPGMFLNAKRQAFERLRAQGKTYGTFEESNTSNLYQGQILDEVQREILVRAKKAGVAVPAGEGVAATDTPTLLSNQFFGTGLNSGILGGNPVDRAMTTEKTRAEFFQGLERKIGAAGGGGIDNGILADLVKKQIEATKAVEDAILKGQNRAPGGGAPPIAKAPPTLPATQAPPQRRPGNP